MSTKPTYLGLLNAISNAESEAERYLDAWAATTTRDDVRQVITMVALREGEHGKSFAKRVCELGFAVVPKTDGKGDDRMAIACSTTLSDREKFEALGVGRPIDSAKPDIFAGMFADQSIDIQTGTLLGRYIAEERDTGRLLRACYEALCEEEACAESMATASDPRIEALESRLGGIEAQLALLVKASKQNGKK